MGVKSVLAAKAAKALKSVGPTKTSKGRNKVSTRVEKDMGTAQRVEVPKLTGPKTSGGRNKSAKRGAAVLATTAAVGVGIGASLSSGKKAKAGVSANEAKSMAQESMTANRLKRVANPKMYKKQPLKVKKPASAPANAKPAAPTPKPRPANKGSASVGTKAKANAGVRSNSGASKPAPVQEGPTRKPVMPKKAKKGLSEATRKGRDKFLSAAYAEGGYVEKKAGGGLAGMMKSYIEANHPAYKKGPTKTILRDNAPKASSASPKPRAKGGGRRQLLADKYQNMGSNQYACGGFVERKAVGGVAQTQHTKSVRKISNH